MSRASAARPAVRRFLDDYIASYGVTVRSVLETGCGTGLLSKQLVGLAADLHGVDFSRGQIMRALEKRLPVYLAQGDVLALPYRDEQFDVVVSFEMLPHLPGKEAQYCREAFRVLRPGGVLLLDAIVRSTNKRLPARFQTLLYALFNAALAKLTNVKVWSRTPSEAYLLDTLRHAGFEAEMCAPQQGSAWRFPMGRKPL